jgi:hypothetical protein
MKEATFCLRDTSNRALKEAAFSVRDKGIDTSNRGKALKLFVQRSGISGRLMP